MNKNRVENLTLNKKFLNWCEHADGKSKSSIRKIAYDIQPFIEFMGTSNYKMITSDLIVKFKNEQKESGISLSAYCSRLRNTRKLFGFMMSQHGFKSRITPALIKYMSPSDEESRMAQIPGDRNIMPLESVIVLLESIPDDNPISMRDRAIISTLVTTGIRHKALITIPLGYIHLEEGFIYQDPRVGVNTKYKKLIKSAICNLDDRFIKSLKNWKDYLSANGFGTKDPFIPRAKRESDTESRCFTRSIEVEPKFWKSHHNLTDILKKRCKQASLPYFPPHSFRHLLVKIAKEMELTSKESKCFSQSLGHEHERTTWGYGKFSEEEVVSVVSSIDFQKKVTSNSISDKDIKEYNEFRKWKKTSDLARILELDNEK